MEEQIIQLLFYCIPAIVTGGVAYYFFSLHTKNEEGRRRYLLHKESQKDALPVRLQAYERMTLFLERIAPASLTINLTPVTDGKDDYENRLIQQIETEFNHNLAQQIYLTEDCWGIIRAAKNTTIQMIRKIAMSEKIDSASKLREAILTEFMDKQAPSATALSFIKKEVSEIIG
ncbi:hypothetical protein SAMN05216480_106126 [Pustulibacterium marinum]|uniref:Uncharacterized protein n=1 Tax=Pustulibacterium marinum TaxID=1224947 RepID=A0A1I7GZH4_9FLAO|nr:hypothetical protein [Pustulibacterium marinum]SFU53825.1 hypothetical protein SAMN05216480_106126 [Pustulibacterium marinum]